MTRRIEKINSLIRDLAGEFFLEKIKARNTIVSAVRAETSSDLREVLLFIAVFPEKEENVIMKLLKEHKNEWQRFLASNFKAKFLPSTIFLIDKGEKSARRVEELLGRQPSGNKAL